MILTAFYASVEMQRRPELRDKPVAVCGSQAERHGIVLTANYVAKPFGVKTGMTIWQAIQCCPDLVILPPDMRQYIRISKLAREIYEDYTDQIEPFGLDESWLDVTGSVGLFGSLIAMAKEISGCIKFELGITTSIGVADNKITAKFGSDYRKPDAITRIEADNYREIAYPLPAQDLLYVGPATDWSARSGAEVQTSLLDNDAKRKKWERIDAATDHLRQRYGYTSIRRAVTCADPELGRINPRDDHTVHPIGYLGG